MARVKLTEAQRLDFRKVFRDAFRRPALEDLLSSLNKRFDDYAGEGVYPRQVLEVVRGAEDEAWLVELIGQALTRIPGDLELQRIQREIAEVALPIGFEPFELCCLSGDYVMVNRSKLRNALKLMSSPHGKRILVVRDKTTPIGSAFLGTKTGKSLSVQFISALQQHVGGFEMVWMDLWEWSNSLGKDTSIWPRDLALRLVRNLAYSTAIVPDAPTDAQWARWNLDFFDGFEGQARGDPRSLWIVIDEFNKIVLPQPTIDFVKELAGRVRVTLPHFRLVLLGYTNTLGSTSLPLVEEEHVDRTVSTRDLVEFFVSAARQRGLPVSAEQVEDAAAETLRGLDAKADLFLENVGRRARDQLVRFAPIGD